MTIETWLDPRVSIKRFEDLKQLLLKLPPNKLSYKKVQKTLDNIDRTLRMLYRRKRKFEKAGLI